MHCLHGAYCKLTNFQVFDRDKELPFLVVRFMSLRRPVGPPCVLFNFLVVCSPVGGPGHLFTDPLGVTDGSSSCLSAQCHRSFGPVPLGKHRLIWKKRNLYVNPQNKNTWVGCTFKHIHTNPGRLRQLERW